MMKATLKKVPNYWYIRVLITVTLVGLTIWSFLLESNVLNNGRDSFDTLEEGWVQIVDGEEIPLVTPQEGQATGVDGSIVIQCVIPTAESARSLLFYAIHQEVAVYIDDELVYSLTCPEGMEFFASPGRTWVDVPISTNMMGKTLRLEFSSEFEFYRCVPSEFYFIYAGDIQSVQLNFMWLRNTVTIAILALAAISYVNASIWKTPKLRRYLFTMADVYLFAGLWLCSEINLLSVFVGHSSATSFLSMIFIRMVPIAFYHFTVATIAHRPRWMMALGIAAWGNLCISLLLQFAFDISLISTLPATVLILGGSCIVYLVGMILRRIRHRYGYQYEKGYYATAILLVGTLAEIYCYVNQAALGHLNGVFVSVACIIYAALAHVFLVKMESDTDIAKRKLETTYHTLEKKPLYQQINAHFLFNTLNGISAYCKEYPARADQAVGWLAQYMRGYMRLIDCGDYVPFAEEVSLIQIYLNIQSLRYQEEIDFIVEGNFNDFVVPPLTLQPLIENAVNHGIHSYVERGEIRVRCTRYGEWVEMIVSDNGRGCQWDSKAQHNGVGLTNLTRRIKAMDGTLRVEGKVGKGTDVILNIPLNPVQHNNEEFAL